MTIDIAAYLSQAIEQIAGKPVDLTGVCVNLDVQIHAADCCVAFDCDVSSSDGSTQRLRHALKEAGFDDLMTFEITRAFKRLTGTR